ncbi:MAG TPA: sulfotransferase [Anaerolineae bacterium]|nr:sulfotransferase [Anaerolineae bacterium]
MDHGPIYLAGADRSGTTLMSALLATHPHIAIANLGSNMWTFFDGKFGALERPENFERCLAALLRYKNVLVLKPDAARIRREFAQGEHTYARLFRLIEDHFAERLGKPRWGDKTSYVERYASTIFTAYPDAKMIHMVRDPRDRYASAIKRWPSGRGQVGGGTARWLYSVRLAAKNQKRFPRQYKIVRYETLVTRPEETMREVCAFLDEPYDPVMFTMAGAKGFWAKGGNSSYERFTPGIISSSAVGRYHQALSAREIAFIQTFARREMTEYDYVPSPSRFSRREQIAFYGLYIPAHLVRFSAWRIQELLQQHLPLLVGRTPMGNRLLPDP